MPTIINGKEIAEKIREQLKRKIDALEIKPGLASILVGNNPASEKYISLKEKAAHEVGMHFEKHLLPEETYEEQLVQLVYQLNRDKKIHGILIQLPLPAHINTKKAIEAMDPKKDADGFHPETVRNLNSQKEIIKPVMSEVILEIFRNASENIREKTLLFVGNSGEFLKTMEKIFSPLCKKVLIANKNNFQEFSLIADGIIIALGSAHILKPEHIKKNSGLIDIGISKLGEKIVGDIDPACYEKSLFYTPVPGGVGPITVAKLLENTYKLLLAWKEDEK